MRSAYFRTILTTLAWNAVVGVIITVLMLITGRRIGPVWLMFAFNQVFAQTIGSIAAFVIPRLQPRLLALPRWQFWPFYCGTLIVIGLLGAIPAAAFIALWRGWPWGAFLEICRGAMLTASVFTLMVGVTSFLFGSLQYRVQEATMQLRGQQLAKERAEKLASEAQLAALQARVHPHFLFNTINSVLSLIREDPRAAEEMLERLARLLRFSLETQQKPGIPLEEELRLVRDYLEIERARFGERLRFEIDAPAELLGLSVPPHALQTLVENSVKYAAGTRREGARIEVKAARYNGTLALVVRDDGPGFTREALRPGHGLDTLEKRLEALYGREAFLQVSQERGAVVAVRLPV
jgi:hypothetical protein